jgi:MFS family permease
MAISHSLVFLILGVALTASGAGAVSAVVAAWLGDLVTPAKRGFTMGIYSTAGDIGSTTGPVLAYALITANGLNNIYYICAGLFAVSLLVMSVQAAIIRKWQRKSNQTRSHIGY